MYRILKSLFNCVKLLFLSRRLKSLFNFLPAKIKFQGQNIIIQDSKIVGDLELSSNVKINDSFLSGNISINRFTSINGPNTSIITAGAGKVSIGSFCSIARGVQIQEFNHNFNRATSYYIFQNIFKKPRNFDITTKGNIVIEDDVWIGANCIILSGVKVGRGSIIAAGSVVIKDVDPFAIVAGVPAKFIKPRFSDNTIAEIKESKWWTWDIDKILENEHFFLQNRT